MASWLEEAEKWTSELKFGVSHFRSVWCCLIHKVSCTPTTIREIPEATVARQSSKWKWHIKYVLHMHIFPLVWNYVAICKISIDEEIDEEFFFSSINSICLGEHTEKYTLPSKCCGLQDIKASHPLEYKRDPKKHKLQDTHKRAQEGKKLVIHLSTFPRLPRSWQTGWRSHLQPALNPS